MFFIQTLMECIGFKNRIQEYFSAEKQPTLWHALPALKELQSVWDKKHKTLQYALYKDALSDGIKKLHKYYSQLDKKPSFVLALSEITSLVFRSKLMNTFQCSILTISSPTLNWHGVVQKSRLLKLQQGCSMKRTGKTRQKKLLKTP